ncbi:MAG: hypothetical protein QME12_01935 [Nanoarchaeota archaeon]|nr:hypothetical protein [Nanoarchaeota archaeon]
MGAYQISEEARQLHYSSFVADLHADAILADRLCSGNTDADRWAAAFYRKMGYNAKTGVPCADVCKLLIVGNTFIQIYLPAELRKKLGLLLEKKIDSVDIGKLASDVFEKKTSIEVVISSNEKIASQIMESTMKHFR